MTAMPWDSWVPLLDAVDVAVNTVGIFRETPQASFEEVHVQAPGRLFEACAAAGVRRVLHVSALGADEGATTGFHLSKRRGDERLLRLDLDATVVQPSLVFSADGASSRALLALAAAPGPLVLPGGGTQALQPIHLDDAADAIIALIEQPGNPAHRRIALVGPAPITLRDYVLALRLGLGLRAAPVWPLPRRCVEIVVRVFEKFPHGLFDRAAWSMLERGNTGDCADVTTLLGAPPRPPSQFIASTQADSLRSAARLVWSLASLRLSLAFVWLWTAAVSAWAYPVDSSLMLLARAGVPAPLQPFALYAAAALDALLGLLTLVAPAMSPLRRWWLWLTQAAMIVGYTLVITLRLPEYWLHPYGPLSKNIPMLAALWLLASLERRATPRR